MIKMNFKTRVYRVNKNKKYHSYFATIKQDEFKHLKLKDASAILLSIKLFLMDLTASLSISLI